MTLLLGAVALGAVLQAGIGIGFSIIAGPLLFVQIGAEAAVPLLLLLNAMVSAVATPGAVGRGDRRLIFTAALACVAGITAGIAVYPLLTEPMVLGIAGGLLVFGAFAAFLPVSPAGKRALLPISGLSGLATVWAATPGPLMALGLILADHPASNVRKLVQPIALIGYTVAFLLHAIADWHAIFANPQLPALLVTAAIGSVVGRLIGPSLPRAVITNGIRGLSLLAGALLLHRALTFT